MKYLITADWHLQKAVPPVRTQTESEWIEEQFQVIRFIFDKAEKENCDGIIIAGDIFDRAAPGNRIVNKLLHIMSQYNIPLYANAGNHDEPYHNFDLIDDSGFGVLMRAGVFSINDNIYVNHFGIEPMPEIDSLIAVCHHLVFDSEKSIPPNVNAFLPSDIFEMYPNAKYIICGDNHHSFVAKSPQNATLIVPGCITLRRVNEMAYEPLYWLLDTTEDVVTSGKLPVNLEVLNDEYKIAENERNERIEAFVSKLNAHRGSGGFSFEENLQEKLKLKSVSKAVKNIILQIQGEIYEQSKV